MVKRAIRRRVQNVFLIIALIIGAIVLIVALLAGARAVLPIFQTPISDSDRLIKPIGSQTTLNDLKKLIDEKNIIFESLKESSTSSSLIVGKMKDGPTVYFTESADATWQVNSLQLILSHLTIDNKKPTLVDLRQGRPIVKF